MVSVGGAGADSDAAMGAMTPAGTGVSPDADFAMVVVVLVVGGDAPIATVAGTRFVD
ncbi:MAG: hypothetical protein ACRD16_04540 [Thermoanaerobaculia bacterium]